MNQYSKMLEDELNSVQGEINTVNNRISKLTEQAN